MMDWLALALMIIGCLAITYQDFKVRYIHLFSILILALGIILYRLEYITHPKYIAINYIYIVLLILVLYLYFRLKYRKKKFTGRYIGIGDLVLFGVFGLFYGLQYFILFLIFSCLISLCYWMIMS